MGREGAEHYKKRMRQKAMAKRLAEADESGLTSKDAQKLINEAMDVQKKADASRAAVFTKPKATYNNKTKYTKPASRNKPRGNSFRHPPRSNRAPPRGRPQQNPRSGTKRKPRSGDTA